MRIWYWLQRNSLWIMSIGLMAASSGIDGAYMAAWMPVNAAWLGYVLNTTSDVASEVLMYWFGRLQQERKNSKKWRLSRWILVAEILVVAFSWFFGWRQLLMVLPQIEGDATAWVAPISAAFVPLLLAATGYAQALLAGKFGEPVESKTESETSETQSEESEVEPASVSLESPLSPDYETVLEREGEIEQNESEEKSEGAVVCEWCGRSFGTINALNAHKRFCEQKGE
jgi:hypothetical protein